MKLIPMTEFVLQQKNENPSKFGDYADMIKSISNYAEFLKQPLKLEMFVPCDEDGNVIVIPSIYDPRSKTGNTDIEDFEDAELKYNKAKGKVLFEGVSKNIIETVTSYYKSSKIESLLFLPIEINLTQTGIKLATEGRSLNT